MPKLLKQNDEVTINTTDEDLKSFNGQDGIIMQVDSSDTKLPYMVEIPSQKTTVWLKVSEVKLKKKVEETVKEEAASV